MYSYYLAAAVLKKDKLSKLHLIKENITLMQMIQFGIILFHMIVHKFWYKCQYNDFCYYFFMIGVAIIFYSFYDFYMKSYKKSSSKIN